MYYPLLEILKANKILWQVRRVRAGGEHGGGTEDGKLRLVDTEKEKGEESRLPYWPWAWDEEWTEGDGINK